MVSRQDLATLQLSFLKSYHNEVLKQEPILGSPSWVPLASRQCFFDRHLRFGELSSSRRLASVVLQLSYLNQPSFSEDDSLKVAVLLRKTKRPLVKPWRPDGSNSRLAATPHLSEKDDYFRDVYYREGRDVLALLSRCLRGLC